MLSVGFVAWRGPAPPVHAGAFDGGNSELPRCLPAVGAEAGRREDCGTGAKPESERGAGVVSTQRELPEARRTSTGGPSSLCGLSELG